MKVKRERKPLQKYIQLVNIVDKEMKSNLALMCLFTKKKKKTEQNISE